MIINKKKPKTLVCILGETRAQDVTWSKFNINVLKNLNADLAICVAEKKTSNNKMYKNAKFIWKYKDAKDYTNYFDYAQKKILELKKIKEKPNWKKMIKIKDFWLARIKGSSKIRSGTGALLIFNRWFLLRKIFKLKLHKEYERFVITRSDFIWDMPHPQMSNLDPSFIWIPNGEHYGGYTDRHAVLSKKNLYDYLNIIEPIVSEPDNLFNLMKSKKNWNLERYIKFYLDRKGYQKKIKFFPYMMYSIRNNRIKTTFRPGKYSHKHQYYIKYFKEYLSSMIIYFLVGGNAKNFKNYNLIYCLYKTFKNLFKIKIFLLFFLNLKTINKNYDKDFVIYNLKKKFIF